MRKVITTLLITAFALFISCDNSSDSGPNFTGQDIGFPLMEMGDSGVSGSVTFSEIEDGSMLAVIELEGTPEDGTHPAHIHMNTATEGGGIVVSFNPVDGETGRSETMIETTDDGAEFNFNDLVEYDGYVNIHLSSDNLSTIVAQGNIGGNTFTGNETQYVLAEVNESGVFGNVTFRERLDGTTLAIIEVQGAPADANHPAHIHENSASEGGPIAISFNNVDGSTGISRTQIETNDAGDDNITYNELIDFDGYINIHLSPDDLATIVAQGNIGANAGS